MKQIPRFLTGREKARIDNTALLRHICFVGGFDRCPRHHHKTCQLVSTLVYPLHTTQTGGDSPVRADSSSPNGLRSDKNASTRFVFPHTSTITLCSLTSTIRPPNCAESV